MWGSVRKVSGVGSSVCKIERETDRQTDRGTDSAQGVWTAVDIENGGRNGVSHNDVK